MEDDWNEDGADEFDDQPEYLALDRLPAVQEEPNAPWALLGLLGLSVLILAWLLLRGG